ncbi:DUF4123 domain-containing protein [Litoreibacter meonggei]|uniref:DUF4123 domain-containing protein n=1 Tax=Litoreibacter meonggei TaxID=1049199 RepID=UPI0014737BF3|nr:DUF4123 domain-containing protein [Litoreibacter meonggei]
MDHADWSLSYFDRSDAQELTSPFPKQKDAAERCTRWFAILDAAKIPNLEEILASQSSECRCLFSGKTAEDIGAVSPWLVDLDKTSSLAKSILSTERVPLGYWSAEAWVAFEASAPFDDLWSHLRKFTRVWAKNGSSKYFRFYEANNYRTLSLEELSSLNTYFCKLFSDRISRMSIPDVENDALQILEFAGGTPIARGPNGLRLSESEVEPILERALDLRFRKAALEMMRACEDQDISVPSERDCVRVLLILRDECGYRYWDDMTRAGTALAVEQLFSASAIRARLQLAPFTSKSEQALYLWNSVVRVA